MNSISSSAQARSNSKPTSKPGAAFNRRAFVKQVLAAGAAANALGVSGGPGSRKSRAADLGLNSAQRRSRAYEIRQQAAMGQMQKEIPDHITNGDEAAYVQKLGNFSKALPHNELGEVNPD